MSDQSNKQGRLTINEHNDCPNEQEIKQIINQISGDGQQLINIMIVLADKKLNR